MGSLVGGEGAEAQEGTRRPSRRHRSDVHQSDDNRRETRPEFLDRQVTPEQHRSDGCMSTYTWVLFKRKHFRTTRSAERTVAAVGGPPVTYGRILHCGSLEALAPALFKGQQHLWINSFGKRSVTGGEENAGDMGSAFLGVDSTSAAYRNVGLSK